MKLLVYANLHKDTLRSTDKDEMHGVNGEQF